MHAYECDVMFTRHNKPKFSHFDPALFFICKFIKKTAQIACLDNCCHIKLRFVPKYNYRLNPGSCSGTPCLICRNRNPLSVPPGFYLWTHPNSLHGKINTVLAYCSLIVFFKGGKDLSVGIKRSNS